MSLGKLLLLFLGLIQSTLLFSQWPKTTSTSKPWTRWWWHGSAVTREGITQELESFHQSGIGGVEITPIYGVDGMESLENVFLSEEWLDLVEHTCLEAKRLGMEVDIVQGTGWRFGSEVVPDEERAVRLKLYKRSDGDKLSYSYKVELSGEKVKRAAPGGGGFTIDMLDGEAVRNYLNWFNEPFFDAISPGLVRAVFHDSWEYNTDWTNDFESEFLKRRGFDVSEILPIFDPVQSSVSTDTIERLRYAYRLTLEELLLENFCGVWNESTHGYGLLTRNQGHGSIANLLDVYAMADIPETEIFRDRETYIVHKFASSAALVTGKKLVSSETFTWLSEHWTVDLAKLKRFTDYLFLCGTNHIQFHGTAYSPDDASWPGWVFYASTQLNDRNPIWNHMPVLNDYMTRCQSMLQAGHPFTEAFLYWPIADLYAEAPGTQLRLHIRGDDWLEGSEFERAAQQLWDLGVHANYVSDRQLQQFAKVGQSTPLIILPTMKRIPLATLEALNKMASHGIRVISLDSSPKWKVPDAKHHVTMQKQLDSLLKEIIKEKRIEFRDALDSLEIASDSWQQDSGLRTIRRVLDDGTDIYFIVNRGNQKVIRKIPLHSISNSCDLMYPWSGKIETVSLHDGKLEIALESNESVFVKVGLESPGKQIRRKTKQSSGGRWIALEDGWALSFVQGGPDLPEPIKLMQLEWITEMDDQRMDYFSGLLSYKNTFKLNTDEASHDIALDLGELSSSAQVFVNGNLVGTTIEAPHKLWVPSKVLKNGTNTIVVEVATLADNRIRYMDRNGIKWRIFKDINFRSLEYGDFDASNWVISDYGLKGPVGIVLGD